SLKSRQSQQKSFFNLPLPVNHVHFSYHIQLNERFCFRLETTQDSKFGCALFIFFMLILSSQDKRENECLVKNSTISSIADKSILIVSEDVRATILSLPSIV